MIDNIPPNISTISWKPEENKYIIKLADSVKFFVPYPQVGKLYVKGQIQEKAFKVDPGEILEFFPHYSPGELTWCIEIRDQGLIAVAKVIHHKPGVYILPEVITEDITIRLGEVVIWRESEAKGEYWDEKKLQADLIVNGIVHGVLPTAWENILAVNGSDEVVIAQGTPPTLPIPAQLIDLTEGTKPKISEDERVDYFASKLKLVEEGQPLARKIPGVPGAAGKNVKGLEIPAPKPKELQFKLKKNVRLSEDGCEVIANVAGLPLRMDEWSFGVEPAYTLNQDLDLAIGSIEFPGDVFIAGDVHDGLHVYSGGKVEIRGSVFHAEIRAEKGLSVYRNVMAANLVVGERFVIRSKLIHDLHALSDSLTSCLMTTEEFTYSPHAKNLKPGQCLKLITERRFPELPKLAADFEKFLLTTKDELISQDLILSARTAKHFLTGLGPLNPQALPLLEKVNKAFELVLANIAFEVPEKLECYVDYTQGATIECAGNFLCRKGAYNSNIRASGDLRIEGVCRGGKIISGGNVEIKELGGSGVSATTVQFPGTKRLKVGFCHANVIVIVDKEIISLEEPYRSLEIYREHGKVQVEKLRWEV